MDVSLNAAGRLTGKARLHAGRRPGGRCLAISRRSIRHLPPGSHRPRARRTDADRPRFEQDGAVCGGCVVGRLVAGQPKPRLCASPPARYLPPHEWSSSFESSEAPNGSFGPGRLTSVLMPSDWTPDGQFILGSLVRRWPEPRCPPSWRCGRRHRLRRTSRPTRVGRRPGRAVAGTPVSERPLAGFRAGKVRPDDGLRVSSTWLAHDSPPGMGPHRPAPSLGPKAAVAARRQDALTSFPAKVRRTPISGRSSSTRLRGSHREPFKLTSFNLPDLLVPLKWWSTPDRHLRRSCHSDPGSRPREHLAAGECRPLVSRHRGSWHKSRSAAPGSQGAKSELIGHK